MKIDVEICIDCSTLSSALLSAEAAVAGGANRIECCARMEVGGLTPDLAIMQEIVDAVGGKIEILSMIRPREGLFDFSRSEKMLLLNQAESHIAIGIDGIVFGATENGSIDEELCEELAAFASYHNVKSTFHRAFDDLTAPEDAIDLLYSLGISRILTAGIPWPSSGDILDGLSAIQKYALIEPEMEWVVGGGVSAKNAPQIIQTLSKERFSIHTYSSVLENGVTSSAKVEALVSCTKK